MTVEALFNDTVEGIRVAHECSVLPWLTCAECLFGTWSQNPEEIAGARSDGERNSP
jgi:hypothetical protein